MNNFFIFFMAITILTLSPLKAAIYKGQAVYVKECSKCHSNGQAYIASRSISKWNGLMKNKGKPLADIHLKDNRAKKSWRYFTSSKYSKKSRHLRQFLVEYAKDTGNIPACN